MRRRIACALSGGAVVLGCRQPTEITFVFSTDEPCASAGGTTVTVGGAGDVETKAPATSSQACGDGGDLGALVVGRVHRRHDRPERVRGRRRLRRGRAGKSDGGRGRGRRDRRLGRRLRRRHRRRARTSPGT